MVSTAGLFPVASSFLCSQAESTPALAKVYDRRRKGEMNSEEKFFTQTDAWVFASLRSTMNGKGFSFVSFLAKADMLNHAIMTQQEIKQGLTKLHMRGLIEVEKEAVRKTELAERLYSKIDKRHGGLFSIIGNCFDVLNSPRTKLPFVGTPPDLEFLTPEYINDKYEEYINWAKSGSSKFS